MHVADKIVVVTGGASGIGRALCERFQQEGARTVVVADINAPAAEVVATRVDGVPFAADVSREENVIRLVEEVEDRIGPIDLFCSNAGIAVMDPSAENAAGSANSEWQRCWEVNVMAHVYAARALIPRMAQRGGGYLLHTVSAAGLLSQIGSAVYSTTKHAAVGFAENIAIMHRDQGIRVSILCPEGVDTPLLRSMPTGAQALDGILSPEQVAAATVAGLEQETFLILPHVQVAAYLRNKASDYDRWIGGMARLHRSLSASGADPVTRKEILRGL